jgi:hypothetical protein
MDDLTSRYAEAARQHAAASERGDYRTANQTHDLITQIYHELHARGPEGQRELLALLRNADASVRLWAAVHSLAVIPNEAEAVLEEIAGGVPSLLRLSAEMSLSEWRSGQLRIP